MVGTLEDGPARFGLNRERNRRSSGDGSFACFPHQFWGGGVVVVVVEPEVLVSDFFP